MKYVYSTLFVLFSNLCLAQNSTSPKPPGIGTYKWNEVVFMQPCQANGNTYLTAMNGVAVAKPPIMSAAGQYFRVLRIVADSAIIVVVDYKAPSTGNAANEGSNFFLYNFSGSVTDYRNLSPSDISQFNWGVYQAYFKISISELTQFAEKSTIIPGHLNAGVINFPFKYRWQRGGDFSGAFNFGAGIEYTLKHSSNNLWARSFLLGFSITNIVLDKETASKGLDQLASTNNFSGLSLSTGFLVAYRKVQAGIFIGWDRLGKLNQTAYGWKYQSRPWASIGLGLAIFSDNEDEKSPVKQPSQPGG